VRPSEKKIRIEPRTRTGAQYNRDGRARECTNGLVNGKEPQGGNNKGTFLNDKAQAETNPIQKYRCLEW